MLQYAHQGCTISLLRGDITKEPVDAIVNAANRTLLGGGGVDGAIHRAAGPELLIACRRVREQVLHGALAATAQPVLTYGYRLPAKYVVHTTGPVYAEDDDPDRTLTLTYWNALRLAIAVRQPPIASIAFPSISTGAFGFPIRRAAPLALRAMLAFLNGDDLASQAPLPLVDPAVPGVRLSTPPPPPGSIREIRVVLFSDADLQVYEQALDDIAGPLSEQEPGKAGG
ncbi:macro domain-containing protein [Alicyclobacillus shizuokensis]|uniref:macro domain-containing protein n=1 Tax=Alicyclobacillus shizuokensis TaxID=392014 RepID=UPI00082D2BD4|nr:macro domain-containing protein [Alicyclobacillus shizuokensis]